MSGRHRFRCRSCGADILVDDTIRESILVNGCPICDASATEDAIEAAEGGELSTSQ